MNVSKHAYLIIAHHEFELLQKLIDALDDDRNDIYIHIDKKVKKIPVFHSQDAGLYIINNRIDVRWGHISQIESEYALFEIAYKSENPYERYHLISGTHLPLKNQNVIHDFFAKMKDKEVFNFLYTNAYEANFKINRYHFFIRNHRNNSFPIQKISQLLWHLLLKIQYICRIQKKKPKVHIKANNWVSLTQAAIEYIIKEKKEVLKLFRSSFCGDEFFIPYLLSKTPDKFQIINDKRLLFNEFEGSKPRTIKEKDFHFLITSDYLFARKFSTADIIVVNNILSYIKSDSEK